MNTTKSKTIIIDIDGTVCTEEKVFERTLAKPLPGALEKVNDLFKKGHVIIFWTARGWEQYKITKIWLDEQGFKYHQLIMGKPIVDLIIDDRAMKFEGWDKNYLNED
ncbi:MAG: hypothetical protein EPN39_04650 [Chitinophagaceae bacterium]|nr:MAG: hypothetical protein EPN39_04650 [Chitinophagaceae bacterium]